MDSHDIESYFRQHRKTLAVIFLSAGMLAVSGFFMGMRQTERQPTRMDFLEAMKQDGAVPQDLQDIPEAPKYKDIAHTKWQANSDWKFTLANLPRAVPPVRGAPVASASERAASVGRRSSLRAYDGAPPVIPHAIDTINVSSCISCHGPGTDLVISGKRPAEMSHPWITNCTSCHVPADGLRAVTAPSDTRLVVDNGFSGKPSAGAGPRAYGTAPPTTPHPVWMRQNCMACHGPGREQAIRTSHPERRNCLQCHAPNAAFDNRESYLTNKQPPVASQPTP